MATAQAGILAAVYVAVLDVTIVTVAVPNNAAELHADTRGLQSAFMSASFAALVLAAGKMSKDGLSERVALQCMS